MIIITGGSSGLGKAISVYLRSRGEKVITLSRRINSEDSEHFSCDISNYDSIKKVYFEIRNKGSASHITECKELQKKGTVVTFPSYVWHRVKPVTKGVRYSLVFWHLGYPFK